MRREMKQEQTDEDEADNDYSQVGKRWRRGEEQSRLTLVQGIVTENDSPSTP